LQADESLDDVTKPTPEYNNAANLSREYRSVSNGVQLEGATSQDKQRLAM